MAPELSYLSVELISESQWSRCRLLFECQNRPPRYPKLRSLNLRDSYQKDILRAFPTIIELDITGGMYGLVLKDLVDSDKKRSSPIVPHLAYLVCDDFDQTMMHRLIASREALGCPLNLVVLNAGDGSGVRWRRERSHLGKIAPASKPIACAECRCGWARDREQCWQKEGFFE